MQKNSNFTKFSDMELVERRYMSSNSNTEKYAAYLRSCREIAKCENQMTTLKMLINESPYDPRIQEWKEEIEKLKPIAISWFDLSEVFKELYEKSD